MLNTIYIPWRARERARACERARAPRAGKTPSEILFFAKKPPKSSICRVFGYFIQFVDGFGLRNLSRIRDLLKSFRIVNASSQN